MPTPVLMPSPRQRFFDNIGLPLVRGYVFTFAAGTSTKLAAYQDAAGLIPHENPIRLDDRGEATIYWLGNYKVDLRTAGPFSTQVPGYPVDNFNAVDSATATGDSINNALSVYAGQNGASLLGFIQSDVGSVKRTIQDKLRESVSILDFGAKADYNGSGGTDNAPAMNAAIATGKAVYVPPGRYYMSTSVTTDLNDVVIYGAGKGSSLIYTGVPGTHAFFLGTIAVLAKGGLRVSQLGFIRLSGSTSCMKIVENLDAEIFNNSFSGYNDFTIEAQRSDGTIISKNVSVNGSIKAYSEMDRLVIRENDIQASTNNPGIQVFGGAGVVIEKNFVNWGQHEAIVLGYDSGRGDYSQSPCIRNNYLERNCQADQAGAKRPYIHVGKPINQLGVTYAGTEVVRWPEVRNNYINADVSNANLANVIPAMFERVVEVNWGGNRVLNFTSGGADALHPRVMFPAKFVRTDNMNTRFVDVPAAGKTAFQQCTYPATSMYRTVEFYLGTITITTDVSGYGFYNFTNIGTGITSLDAGRLIVVAMPSKDCRTYIDNKSVSSASDTDDSDRVTWRVNVGGAPISSTIDVTVRAIVTIPI